MLTCLCEPPRQWFQKYLRYFAASSSPLQGNPTQCSRGSKKNFWLRCRGGSRKQVNHTKYPSQSLSLALHYLPFASRFPLPHFTLAVLFALSFPISSSLSRLPFPCCLSVCLCVGLLVAMAQDNTKLCDFSNTNNSDFLSTLIAPLNNDESCEINTALLNLVMKDHFLVRWCRRSPASRCRGAQPL